MHDNCYENRIEQLLQYIKGSKNVCFFGGAGVSTGSGILDFRSENGLYNQKDNQFSRFEPEFYLSQQCLRIYPTDFFSFYKHKMDARHYKPNVVHNVIARLENEGKVQSVITQNVDTLHEKAGSKHLIKLHGTISKNHCIKCRKEYDEDFIFESKEDIPHCPECGGIVRPNIVLYGEALPVDATKAIYDIANADCLIVCGCSLTVYPAANYINYFGQNLSDDEQAKTKMIIINREPTSADNLADLIFHEDMNKVFKDFSDKYF